MKFMRITPHLLRSALLGFLGFLAMGALSAPDQPGVVFGMGIIGALAAFFAALLLLLFPVGPVAKVLIGALCGPTFPTLLLIAGEHDPQGVRWMVFVSMILGLLVGMLEASRILRGRGARSRTGAARSAWDADARPEEGRAEGAA